MTPCIRIGTRGSPLALWQANDVALRLRPFAESVLVEIQTAGDQVRDVPLSQLGGDGAFTKEIQRALLENRVDVAVHSLKDLPTVPVAGLVLAAVPPRGPTGDVFISKKVRRFDDLPPGALVATGSQRRRAQLLHRRPDLQLVPIRGNIETRLRKLNEHELDGLILAEAGLVRLGLQDVITEKLDPSWMLPAVGQGALGLECRAEDLATRELLRHLDDREAHCAVRAERSFLHALGGGCQMPVGAVAVTRRDGLSLRGAILDADGKHRVEDGLCDSASQPEALGQALARKLLAAGGAKLLRLVQRA